MIEKIEKVFLSENNMATFICKACGKARRADMSKYRNHDKAVRVKVKCQCGHSQSVLVERRKLFRKNVSLPGRFSWIDSAEEKKGGWMTVQNISRAGLRIKFHVEQDIKVGMRCVVEFNLDDSQGSLIEKEGVVRMTDGLIAGVEFDTSGPTDPTDKTLGFYFFQ
jgi:hypothetical protein